MKPVHIAMGITVLMLYTLLVLVIQGMLESPEPKATSDRLDQILTVDQGYTPIGNGIIRTDDNSKGVSCYKHKSWDRQLSCVKVN